MSETRQAPSTSHLLPHDFSMGSDDIDFPEALRHAHPPVVQLLGRGEPSVVRRLAQTPGLAIVGSRRASSQGKADARWFARVVAGHGLVIISGLAHGIDTSAHEGALQASGHTVAVLGHGRDHVYPRQNAGLLERILTSGGAAVTEYPDATPARAHQFPMRNRIIAGLAQAVLIVEAAPKSGSLITARHALEAGINVFVIPGSIHSLESQGSNQLIREGAQPVQSPEELLGDMGILRPGNRRSRPSLSGDLFTPDMDVTTLTALTHLSHQASTINDLCNRSGLALDRLYGCLLVLELAHLATRLSDGRWVKLIEK
jgi:DNA processing protein